MNQTLRQVFASVLPYHSYVPSFGLWGFNLAANYRLDPAASKLRLPLRFLNSGIWPSLFVFDPDTEQIAVDDNHLDNQALVGYYEKGWQKLQ